MGFVKSLLGGSSGAGFQAQGATPAQLKKTYQDTQAALAQQNQFVQALQGQNGIQNQSNVFGQQQDLANQLQGMSQGQGPNPALAQLNQATGQNIASQAALMAGQRGAGANAGLIARQAAMQGGNLQQQAVGQGATLQAQQQLAATQALQQQQANMANVAGQQVGQVLQGTGQAGQIALGQQGNILGLQQNANSANASIAQQNAQGQGNLFGNLMGGIGTAVAGPLGGAVASLFQPKTNNFIGDANAGSGNTLFVAKGGEIKAPVVGPRSAYGKMMMAKGGQVKALVSPGEVYLDPKDVQKVAQGHSPIKEGEKVPGTPKVKGAKDSYANDIVPAKLEEGGIVIPRSITQGKNPDKKAAEFVRAILNKKSLPKKGK